MKLELKHIAPYLTYEVNMKYDAFNGSKWKLDIHNLNAITELDKLVLRPLSDLTKDIEYKGEKFVPLENLGYDSEYSVSFYEKGRYFYVYRNGIHCICPQGEMLDKLLEWHFDVYGLIEKGLAIDINSLNNG